MGDRRGSRRGSDVSEFMHAFKLIDKNNDGKISKAELKEVLKEMGRDASEKVVNGNPTNFLTGYKVLA